MASTLEPWNPDDAESVSWLRGDGPHAEIILSTRIRLARNLEGHPFKDFFCSLNYSEVVVPKRIPLLGLGTEEFAASLRQKSA